MGGRVAWSRYEGEDVEAVVAMMVNREHPNSTRITPSQGDGGIDILDRGAASDGGDVVYQVKRYASPLTPDQKSKVVKSAKRFLGPKDGEGRWGRLKVTEWRLVTPWNPTEEVDKWLHEKLEEYDVSIVWNGLTVVDQLAAKYPDVIDSYLHGGASAIKEAYGEVIALTSLGTAPEGDLAVTEVTERIQKALRTLDHDPHYLYEVRFGHGEPDDPPQRPRLVFSRYLIDVASSTWQAVDVLARCAVSHEERPITYQGTIEVRRDSEFVHTLQDFIDFGTPFTSSEGVFSGTLDAPGGLGGSIAKATVSVGPARGTQIGKNPEWRIEILDPDSNVIAQADVDRSDRSHGTAGLRVVLTETHKVFELTFRAGFTNDSTSMSFATLPIDSIPISAALPAVKFLSKLRHPNSYRIGVRHIPMHRAKPIDIPATLETAMPGQMESAAKYLQPLYDLQQHTDTVILVPDLSQDLRSQRKGWWLATRLLNGKSVTATIDEEEGFHIVLPPGTSAPTDTFSIQVPLRVRIGDQDIAFGKMLAEFTDAQLVAEKRTGDGHPVFVYTTPDRRMRYMPDDLPDE